MSYLRSWFSLDTSSSASNVEPNDSYLNQSLSVPEFHEEDEDDGSDTAGEDDSPPAFPAINSAQRAASSSSSSDSSRRLSIPKILTDSALMPPPPVPSLATRQPGVPPPQSSSSLLAPMTTIKPPKRPSRRDKVALAPGFGPLDWGNLKASGQNLRGVDALMRIPPSVLKLHNKKEDAWTAINGKVYNITPYLPFHPGGEKELMRVAGRDGTKLFSLTHAWVNADFMLDACLVGFLVSEPSS
ncbi:cytochrome b5-like heme/steroid binding domain-containing protein [Suillus subalutaceus]|uniref:cytochrome b5-like heme/steroid binding domain-containing protein n=1 Tax=Suillus subalutaceus TaxID=48586 RepID=UPI001B860509|nr:cytochrome b5-like heme/steroid binding domain-containing protein [Suillus subalutaceus]KAG1852771.1 cytochrome b5-like heme/steroid binding domain-containing protein [Suillus subalutaceus]